MRAILKYPGSKWSTADWIISNFPHDYEYMTYLEPYFGSGAVFFNKKRSKIETINDIDANVVNLFSIIRDYPDEFSRQIELTPWARDEYKKSYESTDEPMEKARRFMVRLWMAIGGKTSDITGWSNQIKPVDCGKAKWSRLHLEIIKVSNRLKSEDLNLVQIENMEAIKLIKRYDRAETLLYCDPPYILSTRNKRIYANEMKDSEHIELLEVLLNFKGKVILSGYMSDIYKSYLKHWNMKQQKSNCEMGKSAIEVIWMNYEPPNEQISFDTAI